jgi:hypothetical protein
MDKEAPSFRLGGVSGSGLHPDLGKREPLPDKTAAEGFDRFQEIPSDVFVQGFERAYIQYRQSIRGISSIDKTGQRPEKSRESFAAACGCQGQYMLAFGNVGPGFGLNRGRLAIGFGKPSLD